MDEHGHRSHRFHQRVRRPHRRLDRRQARHPLRRRRSRRCQGVQAASRSERDTRRRSRDPRIARDTSREPQASEARPLFRPHCRTARAPDLHPWSFICNACTPGPREPAAFTSPATTPSSISLLPATSCSNQTQQTTTHTSASFPVSLVSTSPSSALLPPTTTSSGSNSPSEGRGSSSSSRRGMPKRPT